MASHTPNFGRYRLLNPIGAGGMAVVYRAVLMGPSDFERMVVIKRLLPQFSADPSHLKMLANEAKLVSRLQHPNIVQLFEFGEVDGEHYLSMEMVSGLDLSTLFGSLMAKGERLPFALCCLIVARLAAALAYAHELADETGRPLEIVHRDLSPSNVMVTRAGRVKLLDFGIARATGLGQEKTQTGVLKGKLTYMAPEQLEGQPVDARSDIYSLGVIFHELLTGRRLFKAASELEVLRLRNELKLVPPPAAEGVAIPPDILTLVGQMLAPSREDRLARCSEIAERLGPFAGSEGDLGVLAGIVAPQPQPTAATGSYLSDARAAALPLVTDAVVVETARAAPQRRPRLRSSIVGALLIGGGALAAFFWPTRPPPPSPTEQPVASAPVARALPALPAPEPSPAEIVVTFRGSPGAEVMLDGRSRGHLPLELRLQRREAPWAVKVIQPGFEPFLAAVPGDTDSTVEVVSRRLRRPPKKRSEISNPFR